MGFPLTSCLQLINRGGEKISPIELDSALLALEGVAEAVAFGVEDAKYGEKVWAAVVPKSGAKLDEQKLKRALEQKVAKVWLGPFSLDHIAYRSFPAVQDTREDHLYPGDPQVRTLACPSHGC